MHACMHFFFFFFCESILFSLSQTGSAALSLLLTSASPSEQLYCFFNSGVVEIVSNCYHNVGVSLGIGTSLKKKWTVFQSVKTCSMISLYSSLPTSATTSGGTETPTLDTGRFGLRKVKIGAL